MLVAGGVWCAGALLAASAMASCGGSRQGEAKEPAAATSAPAPPEVEAPPPEVEAPPGTFLWGRIENPESLTAFLTQASDSSWGGMKRMPIRLSEVLPSAEQSGPLEFTVAVPSQGRLPIAIVSWGVASEQGVLDDLASRNIEVLEAPGGTHRFTLKGAVCVLGPAAGPLPARVACGEDAQAVDALGDFALRGLPRRRLSDAETHVELAAAPLQRAYGREIASLKMLAPVAVRQLQIDHPRFDRAVADVVFGVLDEVLALSEGLDGVTLQVWQKERGYELSVSGRIRQGSSWSAEALHGLGQRQTIPPAWFWALPSNTSLAFFGQSLPEASSRTPWKVLTDVAIGYLESEGLSATLGARLERWRDEVFELGGMQVVAWGPMAPAPQAKGVDAPAWFLAGGQQDSAAYRKLMDELVDVLGDKDLRQVADQGAPWLPTLKRRGPLPRHPGSLVVEWEARHTPASLLGRMGTWALLGGQMPLLEDALAPEDASQKGVCAIVPDGERTWLACADNQEQLGEPLARVAEGKSDLKQVTGLAQLKESPAFLTGFVKVEQLAAPAVSARGSSWEQVLASLPHGGRVPSTFEVRVIGNEPVEVEVRQRIPEEFVEDLLQALRLR